MQPTRIEDVAIVIPVYQGEKTLPALLVEIAQLTGDGTTSPQGHTIVVKEVVLVNDCSIDNSLAVMRTLAKEHPFVRVIRLSRNFGQHAATLAGMSSTTCRWVVTMDEDGQQDPANIPRMVDLAVSTNVHLVYAKPTTGLPHGWLKNYMSLSAKWVFSKLIGNPRFASFNSFRLVRGDIARTLAAYCGNSVYLDGALSWVTDYPGYCPVALRRDDSRPSGYTYSKLFGHFAKMVLSSTRSPLKFISFIGFSCIVTSFAIACYVVYEKWNHRIPVAGWTSLMVVISFFSGLILFRWASLRST